MRFWDTNDHLISARRPNLIIINIKERTSRILDFAIPANHKIQLKESEKKDKYLDFARELKKTMEREGDNYTNDDCYSWYSHQKISTRNGGLGDKRTGGDCPIYYIIEVGQDTENSPGDSRILAVTKILVENHQLTLMWKTLK